MSPRICCYNQYPGLYQDFDAMREDLQRIQKMGFKQVWVNPFYTPCQYNPVPNMANRIHSLMPCRMNQFIHAMPRMKKAFSNTLQKQMSLV
nr:hypothetical protein [Legionella pneumophila]